MSKGAPKAENCKSYRGAGGGGRSHVIGVGSNVMPGALSSSSTCKRVATLCRKWIAIGSGTGSGSGREGGGEGG